MTALLLAAAPLASDAGDAVEYAWVGWGICAAAVVGYVTWLLHRGRRATRAVPEGRRRWSDPPAQ